MFIRKPAFLQKKLIRLTKYFRETQVVKFYFHQSNLAPSHAFPLMFYESKSSSISRRQKKLLNFIQDQLEHNVIIYYESS